MTVSACTLKPIQQVRFKIADPTAMIRDGIENNKRPDLGIGDDDVTVSGSRITVTVHSLGSVDSPSATIALLDKNGKQIVNASITGLKAPVDLIPKTTDVTLDVPSNMDLRGSSIVIDPEEKLLEITRINNSVIIR